MDLAELRTALRRSWWLIAAVTLLCAGGAVALTARATPRYASHLQLFVTAQAPPKANDATATYQGGLFAQQRVQSYLDIARSERVTAPVVAQLGLPMTPAQLAAHITATAPASTVLINLTVSARSALLAQRIAQAVALQFIRTVDVIEKPSGRGPSPVKLSISVPAGRASSPASPNARLNVGAGIVFGLILGLLAALVRARVDTRIRAPEELSQRAGAPLLGAIPLDKSPSLRAVGPARAEALRQLRTSIRFLDPDHPPQTLVVTSSTADEGKTTTACGLAIVMAEAGLRVVLVDADLRRPRLADVLGLRPHPGLSGQLIGRAPLDELLQDLPTAGDGRLRVLTAGAVPPNPSELLGSRRMQQLLAELRTQHDIVLIDAPPLLPVTDAAVLAGEADGVLVVARMRVTRHPDLGRAVDELARVRARLLGVVANGVAERGEFYVYAHEPGGLPEPSAAGRAPGARREAPSGAR